jgi:hypothetical protein
VSLGKYVLVVLAVVGGSQVLLWPLLAPALGPAGWLATVAGGGLAAANAVVAHGLVVWSAGRSANVFMRAVLGGMVGRMAVMLAAVVALVLGLGLPKVPLAVSLLSYFVFFLAIELTVLHKRTAEASR